MTMWVWWGSRLTPFNFLVGVTGVGIQVFILVPWHHVISEDLKRLEAENKQVKHELKDLKASIDTLIGKFKA